MSNTLWIYGDSFSTDYTREFSKLDGNTWYEYISEHFNLEIKNYAKNGHGVLSVICQILESHIHWNENDLIIIGVPDLFRIDVPQIDDCILIGDLESDEGSKIKSISENLSKNGTDWVEENSLNIWNGFSNLLNHKNLYTFYIHPKERLNQINSLHNGSVMDWIFETKSYISEGDKHFSPKGAKSFYEYILPKISYGK